MSLNNPKRLRHGDHGQRSRKETRHGERRLAAEEKRRTPQHSPTLVFRDEYGDLVRCSCGEQGFDFAAGRDWFAEHMGGPPPPRKSDQYLMQSERARADIASWPEWMRRNLEPPTVEVR